MQTTHVLAFPRGRQAGDLRVSYVPSGDSEIFVMSPEQFNALMAEDRQASCSAPASMLSTQFPWNNQAPAQTWHTPLQAIHRDPITSLNPLATLDRFNDSVKDKTYVDMFGWKDAIMDGRTAIRQVMLLGIMGDAYLTRTKAGKEAVIFKGRPGLRSRLPGTRYLRENEVVRAAEFVIGHKEMLEEAGKASKIAVVTFIAWDIAHELLQDKPDMTRLGVSILSDILQAVTATYLGVGVGIFFAAFGMPIVVTFCFVITLTFVIGMGSAYYDKAYGLTDKAVELARRIENSSVVRNFISFANDIGESYIKSYKNPMIYMSY